MQGNDTVAELMGRLASFEQALAARDRENVALRQDNERLRGQLAQMLKRVFGRSSERADSSQLMLDFASLLDEALRELLAEQAPPVDEEEVPPTERRRRAKAPRGAAAHESVERRREVREPPVEERVCDGCDAELRRIGEEQSSLLEWVPGRFVVVETVRGKWGCGCGLGTVVTAPLPAKPLERSIASPSLLAHLLVSKYQDHLPLARQSAIFRRAEVQISPSTLSDWMHKTARLLAPVYEELRCEILSGGLVRMDDTRLEMQRNSKKLPPRRCYLWQYRNELGTTVFDFALTRSGAEPARFLADFRGWVQGDGYAAHDQLFGPDSGRRRVGCWAHLRRRVVDARESSPAESALALALIGRLYEVEREARKRQLGALDRARLRRERCPQIFAMLEKLFADWSLRARPKSPLGQACTYARSQWPTLVVYIEDGRLEIDNNEVEAGIRGVALGRNSHLFVGSEKGGHDAALFYSLIETCKSAGVEPMAYFQDVLDRIATDPDAALGDLTPARWKAARQAAAATAA